MIINWIRGEDPRFELLDKKEQVIKSVPLEGKNIKDIENLLEEHGFVPVKQV